MSLDVYLYHTADNRGELYWRKITHNLARMATATGLYKPLWHPKELGVEFAEDLSPFLEKGLIKLAGLSEEEIKALSPKNGWGTYDGLLQFTRLYFDACAEFPDAYVSVSR